MNLYTYNVLNILNIKCLYYKNVLLCFHKFKNNTIYVDHIYNTRF